MPKPTFTVRVREIDGEPMLDTQCMSLLFGVSDDDIYALPQTEGAVHIPREWTQRGRRRAREAQAHTGSDALLDGLAYWADHDHGADLVVVYE